MPKNIKITPGTGLMDFIGNTANVAATTFRLTVDASGKLNVAAGASSNFYITNLGIDPAVLLGTANQISAVYGGVNGRVTLGLANAVIFPGTAQIAAAPTNANDIANKAYVDANSNKRLIVRVTTNLNINIASAPTAIDGANLANGDRILLTGQSDNTKNGIYVFSSAGSPLTRATDFNTWTQIPGALISVLQGSSYANTLWMSTSALNGTVESTPITFKRVDLASGVPANSGVVHTDGFVFTASPIVDADVANVSWTKLINVPANITTQTLQSVTQNGNTTAQNIVLLSTGIPAAPANGAALFSAAAGTFGWVSADGFSRTINGTLTSSRTYTLPNVSGSFILSNGVQTIDLKTLTNTTINTGTDATGDLYFRNVSGRLQALPLGAMGQVLGAGANSPVWGNPSVDWIDINNTPTTLSGYGITDPVLLKTGGTMSGDLFLNTDPTLPLQAATKNYVDMIANGLIWKRSVRVATAGVALPANTANVSFQTLTGNVNGVLPAIDGTTLSIGDTLLVMDEVLQENNGAYEVTQLGSGSQPWILTRTSDSNTGDLLVAATYFIYDGATFENRVYTVNTASPIVLGTSDIVFVQTAGVNTYSAGNGLDLTANVFSIATGGVTNAMLENSVISFNLGTAGTSPNLSVSSVALGDSITLNLPIASATTTGVLSATDWTIFNSKLSSLNAFSQGGNSFGDVAVLGTLDPNPLTFVAATIEAARITAATQNFLIGTTTDSTTAKLQVSGSARIASTTTTSTALQLVQAANQTKLTPTVAIYDSTITQVAGLYLDSTLSNFRLTSSVINTTNGEANTAFGHNVMQRLTSGGYNVGIGSFIMINATTAQSNVAIGPQALALLQTGNSNTAIGAFAGIGSTNFSNNVFIGAHAGESAASGNNNVYIGTSAGSANTGSGNVFIGYQTVSAGTSTYSNRLFIDNTTTGTPLIYGEFDNRVVRLGAFTTVAPPNLTGSAATNSFTVNSTWNTTGNPTLIHAVATGPSGTTALMLNLVSNGTSVFSVDRNGNVISLGTVSYKNIYLPTSTTSTGHIYKNNKLFVSSFSGGSTQDNNIFVGYQSGNITNTGVGLNAAVGYNALGLFTSGSENSALGANALKALTTGTHNIAIGSTTLQTLTTGTTNVAIGNGVFGSTLNSGSGNVGIGHQAGQNNAGSSNVFIGYQAGQNEVGSNLLYIANSQTTTPLIWGDFNSQIARINGQLQIISTADSESLLIQTSLIKTNNSPIIKSVNSTGTELFRINSFQSNLFMGTMVGGTAATTAANNVAFGNNLFASITTGHDNAAFGFNNALLLTTGSFNTLVGVTTGSSITTGTYNVGLGFFTLNQVSTGSYNIAIGAQALQSNTIGSNNIAIGYQSGYQNAGGSGNIFIGHQAGYSASITNASNQLIISNAQTTTPLIFGDFNLKYLTFNGTLNLAVPIYNGINPANSFGLFITQTWNYNNVPTLIQASVTDTLSASGALMLRFSVNGTQITTIDKTGRLYLKNGMQVDGLVAPVNAYQYVVWDTTNHRFGVVASGGGVGSSDTPVNGLSNPASGIIQFGQPESFGFASGPAIFTDNTVVPLSTYKLSYTFDVHKFIQFDSFGIFMQNDTGSSINLRIPDVDYTALTLTDPNASYLYLESTNTSTIFEISNAFGNFRLTNPSGDVNNGLTFNPQNNSFAINTALGNATISMIGSIEAYFTMDPANMIPTLNYDSYLPAIDPQIKTYRFNSAYDPSGGEMPEQASLFEVSEGGDAKLRIRYDAGSIMIGQNGPIILNKNGAPGGISLLPGIDPPGHYLVHGLGFSLVQGIAVPAGASMLDYVQLIGNTLEAESGSGAFLNIIGSSIKPAGGNAQISALKLSPTINQTGAATGITRGLHISPLILSAVDFRAIEVTTGVVILKSIALGVKVESAAQTLDLTSTHWVFTGTSPQTWLLPSISTHIGTTFFIKNRGTANLTLEPSIGGQQMFNISPIATLTIAPGVAFIVINDGTYWILE